jgi:radical SAM superfamily enzyme YgiQ (UPF0313 family)
MHYEEPIFRPPSESDSILLQATIGCSHNKCSFCGAYRNKRFRIQESDILRQDLQFASKFFKDKNRLFLCDGDALIIAQDKLMRILTDIKTVLPHVTRVGSYANAKSIARKSISELIALKNAGLHIIHMGLESGDDATLASVNKWGSAGDIIDQGKKIMAAGINLFVTVIVGLGGTSRSEIHARQTGLALTQMAPSFVGALSLMPVNGTEIYTRMLSGDFHLPNAQQMLQELRTMLEATELKSGVFYANHASNFLPLKVRFPKDKKESLDRIDAALRGEISIKADWLRGL